MPYAVVINGETFQYPAPGDVPGWGSQASDAFVAVTQVLNTLAGPSDILQTVATINNNQSSSGNIVGLAFNPAVVKGARVDYNVYRVTSTNEVVEQGTMWLSYKPNAATWDMVEQGSQAANIKFSITSQGQVQYTTDNMPGINYNGQIVFRAIALT